MSLLQAKVYCAVAVTCSSPVCFCTGTWVFLSDEEAAEQGEGVCEE